MDYTIFSKLTCQTYCSLFMQKLLIKTVVIIEKQLMFVQGECVVILSIAPESVRHRFDFCWRNSN